LRRQGFTIHDLFQKGYARIYGDGESSQASSSVAQARIEAKETVRPDNYDDDRDDGSSNVQALPAFVEGQWHGNM
jgi:hypothetical protein